jgi:multidrug efflux pump
MVIGVTPLLVADGAGAKSRFDIGVVIAAGMTIGTMFTLFITPAIYSFVARDRHGKAVAIASAVEAVPLPGNQNSKKKRPAPPRQEAAE